LTPYPRPGGLATRSTLACSSPRRSGPPASSCSGATSTSSSASKWTREQLAERIGGYDGILIRSTTKLDAELIAKATRLRAVGRAGVAIDNVDVAVATKRGIVVANAPQSNVITAAEHTMALLLALARNIPQAHASLISGRWERSKFSGVELCEKTLGILGFGRIGQLVAQRARGSGMRVIAFDPYVGAERYRDLTVQKAASSDEVYAAADFITLHLPSTPKTRGWLDAEALAKCKDGVRVLKHRDRAQAGAPRGRVRGTIAKATRDAPARWPADEWFATHPSASLDDAGARFRHLGGLQRTLGTNGKQASVIWGQGRRQPPGVGARVLSAKALVSMSVPVGSWRLSPSPRRRRQPPTGQR
jgi:D-isomer specific 2-hydroxyacid dehydrogenase, NAD binding domain/D-isomer specific 2-hydroxyacid dehydrogenase, catalytic domain